MNEIELAKKAPTIVDDCIPSKSSNQIWVQLWCNKTSQRFLWTPKLAIGAADFI
jgi:hypothetical protein